MRELMRFDPLEDLGRISGGREQEWNFVPAFEVKELKDGVLNLRLPKVPEVQPRRIQVGSTENKQGQVKA
jgi:hypothetical protein